MTVEKEQGKDVQSTTYNTHRCYDFTSTRGGICHRRNIKYKVSGPVLDTVDAHGLIYSNTR